MTMSTTLQKFTLLLLAGALFAGCSDKTETPTYKPTDGLLVSTPEALREHSTLDTFAFVLTFYCDLSFPLVDFADATATIHPLSEPALYLRAEGEEHRPATSIPLTHTNTFIAKWKYSDTMPYPQFAECGEEGYTMYLTYYFPGAGEYDFFLRFEKPETGLYYQTPNYRLKATPDPKHESAWFTTLTTLNQ